MAKHGLSFVEFEGFDAPPVVIEDDRFDYGEVHIGHSASLATKADAWFSRSAARQFTRSAIAAPMPRRCGAMEEGQNNDRP